MINAGVAILRSLSEATASVDATYTGQANVSVGTIALNTDRSIVAAGSSGVYARGQRIQVELINTNGDCPVELVSISVEADILDHMGD